jgi:AcrR family transcriptional regulator
MALTTSSQQTETSEKISGKAYDLFMSYGIHGVTMNDIATVLGMSKKTIYKYYRDKGELIESVIHKETQKNKALLIKKNDVRDNAINTLRVDLNLVDALFTKLNPYILYGLKKYHSSVYTNFMGYVTGFLYPVIKEDIKAGIQEGLYRKDFNVDDMIKFLFRNLMSTFNTEIFPDNNHEEQIDQSDFLKLFFYGITTCKGRDVFENYLLT